MQNIVGRNQSRTNTISVALMVIILDEWMNQKVKKKLSMEGRKEWTLVWFGLFVTHVFVFFCHVGVKCKWWIVRRTRVRCYKYCITCVVVMCILRGEGNARCKLFVDKTKRLSVVTLLSSYATCRVFFTALTKPLTKYIVYIINLCYVVTVYIIV